MRSQKMNRFLFSFIVMQPYVWLYSPTPAHAANTPACTASSAAAGNCYITPSEVTLTVKGVWYCYGEPGAPTATLANPAQNPGTRGNSGNIMVQASGTGCSPRLFNGSQDVTIADGISSGLTGVAGLGSTQSYTWIALLLGPTISMKSSMQFSATKTTIATKYPTNTSGTASVTTGGIHCYTTGGDFLVENGGAASVECAATSAAQTTNYKYNRIGSENYATWTLSNGKTAKAWLLNSSNKLADALSSADVTRLQALVGGSTTDPFSAEPNPVTSLLVAFENPFTYYKCANLQKGTRGMALSWYVTNSLRAEFSSTSEINLFSPASLDMFLTPVLKSGGAC